jgi:hypothetical protein
VPWFEIIETIMSATHRQNLSGRQGASQMESINIIRICRRASNQRFKTFNHRASPSEGARMHWQKNRRSGTFSPDGFQRREND